MDISVTVGDPVLAEQIQSGQIVVFASRTTDTRRLEPFLEASHMTSVIVLMDLSVDATHQRFQLLKLHTAWPYLPQIFFEGRFIGGAEELFAILGRRREDHTGRELQFTPSRVQH